MNTDIKNTIKTEVLDAWIEYIEMFGPDIPLIEEITGRGYSYEEILAIFKDAIQTDKALNQSSFKQRAKSL